VVSTAAASAGKQPKAAAPKTTPEASDCTEDSEDSEDSEDDEQEQRWVRKIIALAKQTDKSGLPAKAKNLYRMMKADLCDSASASSSEVDDDSSESDEDSHTCTTCGRDFPNLRSLGQHRRYW
jgi:hypothetical protein